MRMHFVLTSPLYSGARRRLHATGNDYREPVSSLRASTAPAASAPTF